MRRRPGGLHRRRGRCRFAGTNPTKPNVGRYETIESWRGVACLAVLFFHSFGAFTRNPIWGPLEPFRAASAYGWLGLHLFFVISGYCIFERLHVGLDRGESIPSFWVDRMIRIYPTYWCVLAITILINLCTLPFNQGSLAESIPLSAKEWFGNLTLIHTLAGWRSSVIVSWTLSYEVTFYLLAGALMLVNGREPEAAEDRVRPRRTAVPAGPPLDRGAVGRTPDVLAAFLSGSVRLVRAPRPLGGVPAAPCLRPGRHGGHLARLACRHWSLRGRPGDGGGRICMDPSDPSPLGPTHEPQSAHAGTGRNRDLFLFVVPHTRAPAVTGVEPEPPVRRPDERAIRGRMASVNRLGRRGWLACLEDGRGQVRAVPHRAPAPAGDGRSWIGEGASPIAALWLAIVSTRPGVALPLSCRRFESCRCRGAIRSIPGAQHAFGPPGARALGEPPKADDPGLAKEAGRRQRPRILG